MYWSDCTDKVPTTIHTARLEDEGDHHTLITGNKDSCVVDIVADFDSTPVHTSFVVIAKPTL